MAKTRKQAPRKQEAGVIATAMACQLLLLSRQRLDQLVASGWITRHSPGHWRTVDIVQGYIRFMRDEGRRTSKGAADSRVRDARAHEIEVRTAERLRRLVALEDFDLFVDLVCGAFRAELSGLPARFTRDLVLRRGLEREIHELLKRVADVIDANAPSTEASSDLAATIGADDAGQMGDSESDLSAIGIDPRAA